MTGPPVLTIEAPMRIWEVKFRAMGTSVFDSMDVFKMLSLIFIGGCNKATFAACKK